MGIKAEPFYFLCYSSLDLETALELADKLIAGPPSIDVWVDKRDIQPSIDWDKQIAEALSACTGLLCMMTEDSVGETSECQQEWKRALTYKKPIVPLRFEASAELPYRLAPRQYIDFSDNFEVGLAKLLDHVRWRGAAEGQLHALKERLEDAKRDLKRASEAESPRILDEINELKKSIETREYAIANPADAAKKTDERIDSALQRERRPVESVHPESGSTFINPPPASAPAWFQDRHVETKLVGNFLQDPALRLMTIVGRGGVGKTVMVCRLLKALEAGHLPDDLGPLTVEGILYLSPKGLRQINLAHLYADLCKLLPPKQAELLEAVYRNPQATVQAKMQALLDAFPRGRTVVLLDNREEVTDATSGALVDTELNDALQTLLEAPEHGIKVLITTRASPRPLQLIQPGRQTLLELDAGLQSPYAENILREMDADGRLGLRDAPEELLALARKHTRGYPRALEALQGILAADRSTTLEEVLAEAEGLLPENVVEVLVWEAFNRLDTQAQQVMQALAIPVALVPEAAVDFLLQPYVADIDSAPVLRRLVNMLFARRDSGRFHLHQMDCSYALERIPQGAAADREAPAPPFTRYALLHRAAACFEQIRTPRASWKAIDDLAPQLAELEVRIAGEEYEAATSVLREIDFDYLMRWGHVRLVARLHERLQGRITDKQLTASSLTILGICYNSLGEYPRAIDHQEQSLAIRREIGDRQGEGPSLMNLGNCYYSLGEYRRAIDHHAQSLAIAREIGDPYVEASDLAYLGEVDIHTGQLTQACKHFADAVRIADEIQNKQNQHEAHFGLALAHLLEGDLDAARTAIEIAQSHDYPETNAAMWTLTGIIRLRRQEGDAARDAFSRGLKEANGLFGRSEQNLGALDTKALALCGLALCDDQRHLDPAAQAFRSARGITKAKGVVTDVLNRFDALAQADTEGILTPLREVAAGN